MFGSFVSGTPTPRSDADLLVIVATSEHTHARDRIPSMLAAMSPLPCPVDLFILTEGELTSAQQHGDPLVREALSSGVESIKPE